MSIIVRPSPYNPIPVVPIDYVKDPTVGYIHPRRVLLRDGLEPHELNKAFCQPVCRTDTVTFQFKRGYIGTTAWNYSILDFYDKEGRYIDYITAPTSIFQLTGEVDEFGEQLYNHQFTFIPDDISFLDGHTYVSIKPRFYFGDGTDIAENCTIYDFTSDMLHLADEHEGTCIIEYSENNNTYDGTLFEYPEIFPKYMLRLPAGRMKPETGGEYTVFQDQLDSIEKLYGNAFNKYNWTVYDIPARLIDVLNYAVKCDNLRIDELEYVLEQDGASDAGDTDKPFQSRTYTFRDKDVNETLTFAEKDILLWTEPEEYPYAISFAWLLDGFNSMSMGNYVFDDTGGVNDYLTLFAAQRATNNATGSFFRTGGNVYYRNGKGQKFKLYAPIQVKPKELIIDLTVTDSSAPFNATIKHTDFLPHFYISKDSSGSGQANNSYSTTAGSNTVAITKPYGSTGAKTLRFFHNDDFFSFTHIPPAGFPVINDITGVISATLNKVELRNEDFSGIGVLDLSFLAPAKDTLSHITIRASQLNGFTSGWSSGLVSGSYKPFPLNYIDIQNNSFDVTNVNGFIVEFFENCRWQPVFGFIATKGQSPAAPPSGTAATYITTLTGTYLWGALTD